MDFYFASRACSLSSTTLHTRLGCEGLPAGLVLEPHQGYHCFRISGFRNRLGFNTVSVSYPMDANNWEIQRNGVATTIETALFSENSLVYIDDLAYEDVCRWSSYGELREEINRLYSRGLFWSISRHQYLRPEQREVIFMVLLLANRLWTCDHLPYLPTEMWLVILGCLPMQAIGGSE